MPERILFPEFRTQFEHTRYPFSDVATLRSSSTNHTLDHDAFLDASLYPIGNSGKLYLSEVNVTTRLVKLTISNERREAKATGSFDPFDQPQVVYFTDSRGRPAGIIVSDEERLARFSSWAIGTHAFEPLATEFAASCVIPTPEEGVRGVLTEKEELLVGDLWLVGDNGVVLRLEEGTADVIRVDIVGDPLFARKLCLPLDLFRTPNFLRTINGCPPDQYGNFNLTVGAHQSEETILRIFANDDGLVFDAVGQLVKG